MTMTVKDAVFKLDTLEYIIDDLKSGKDIDKDTLLKVLQEYHEIIENIQIYL